MILLFNANDFVAIIKKTALDAVDSIKPCDIFFGNVVSITPLKITTDQKLTLGENQLILARNVTDYKFDMTVDHSTEEALSGSFSHAHSYSGETDNTLCTAEAQEPHKHKYSGVTDTVSMSNLTHTHGYVGRKTYLVHNALVKGDKVILLRMSGGQRFLVIDRVGVS